MLMLINTVGTTVATQVQSVAAPAGWSWHDCYQEAALFVLRHRGRGIPMTHGYLVVAASRALRRRLQQLATLVCVGLAPYDDGGGA